MSVNYSAKLIIGSRIPIDKIEVSRPKRGCSHTHSGNFCPVCGAPAHIEGVEEVFDYNDQPPLGIEEFVAIGYDRTREVFIAALIISVGDGDSDPALKLEDRDVHMPSLKMVVKGFLEPLGLWTEESFGTWLVLTVY